LHNLYVGLDVYVVPETEETKKIIEKETDKVVIQTNIPQKKNTPSPSQNIVGYKEEVERIRKVLFIYFF
jgi:hypothetical protein